MQLKARCSIGLTVTKYVGGFGEINESALQLSTLDSDKTIGFIVKQEAKFKPEANCFLQFAILFTTPSGERKIRVFNQILSVTDQPSKCTIDIV